MVIFHSYVSLPEGTIFWCQLKPLFITFLGTQRLKLWKLPQHTAPRLRDGGLAQQTVSELQTDSGSTSLFDRLPLVLLHSRCFLVKSWVMEFCWFSCHCLLVQSHLLVSFWWDLQYCWSKPKHASFPIRWWEDMRETSILSDKVVVAFRFP